MNRSAECAGVSTSAPTRMRATLALSLLVLFAACGRDTGPTSPSPVTPVPVEPTPGPVAVVQMPPPFVMSFRSTEQLWVRLLDARYAYVSGVVTFASSDPTIATVSPTGLVTPIAAGVTSITATSEGKSGSTQVTVAPPTHAFLWTAADGMKDLGVLPGLTVSTAAAINASGEVVGSSWSREVGDRAFRWTPGGGMVDLGGLTRGGTSVARAVNGSGVAVGSSSGHAVLWTPTRAITDLGTLPGDIASDARAIDDAGRVVGMSRSAAGVIRAFIWTPADGMKVIPGLRPGHSSALGINHTGDVVGVSSDGSLNAVRPFRWSAARGLSELPLLAGDVYGSAVAINNRGDAVGISGNLEERECDFYCVFAVERFVLWLGAGGMIELKAAIGDARSVVAINKSGQLGGRNSLGHAFLWDAPGGLRDLGVLAGRSESSALGINDAGQVVGES
ncbi:MAG: hypothetical protein NVS1B4_12230 [Gemmatimonadaceae bacterium]